VYLKFEDITTMCGRRAERSAHGERRKQRHGDEQNELNKIHRWTVGGGHL